MSYSPARYTVYVRGYGIYVKGAEPRISIFLAEIWPEFWGCAGGTDPSLFRYTR
jgi:hypothetical protein